MISVGKYSATYAETNLARCHQFCVFLNIGSYIFWKANIDIIDMPLFVFNADMCRSGTSKSDLQPAATIEAVHSLALPWIGVWVLWGFLH
jgi:hypothetical protein